jgi:hypothetical protein
MSIAPEPLGLLRLAREIPSSYAASHLTTNNSTSTRSLLSGLARLFPRIPLRRNYIARLNLTIRATLIGPLTTPDSSAAPQLSSIQPTRWGLWVHTFSTSSTRLQIACHVFQDHRNSRSTVGVSRYYDYWARSACALIPLQPTPSPIAFLIRVYV